MAGVSSDTLRHYERKRVLQRPPRSANGYRHYPASALERVKLIRSSLAIGFTLDELARILNERDKGGRPCREVHGLAIKKLADLDEQIRALAELRLRLRSVVDDWDKRLSSSGRGTQARLLESLPPDGRSQRTNGSKNLSFNKKFKSGEK
jgi:DNA-binding transcriptional MerR regulator